MKGGPSINSSSRIKSVSDFLAARRYRELGEENNNYAGTDVDRQVLARAKQSANTASNARESRRNNRGSDANNSDGNEIEVMYDGEQVRIGVPSEFDFRDSTKKKGTDDDASKTATTVSQEDSFDDNDATAGQKAATSSIRRRCYLTLPCIIIFIGLAILGLMTAVIIGSRNGSEWFLYPGDDGPADGTPIDPPETDFVLTRKPTYAPTDIPTAGPTKEPSSKPTSSPVTEEPTPLPSLRPTSTPTSNPTAYQPPTPFVPPFRLNPYSQLYYDFESQVHVAPGLNIQSIGRAGSPIPFTSRHATRADSGSCPMHVQPDGAATFQDPVENADGGFHYCSNSEHDAIGGVYCIVFDDQCRVRDYVKRFGGTYNDGCGDPPRGIRTRWNCSGGKTPWNSWVSCEEIDRVEGGGYCWQIDPYGRRDPEPIDRLGTGEFEAMAVDNTKSVPVFYFTEDDRQGALRRFTPSLTQVPAGWDTLHPNLQVSQTNGQLDYLVFDKEGTMGTFHWSDSFEEGEYSARTNYPNTEGVAFAVVDGVPTLFFVAKKLERVFQLNLSFNTWTSRSTNADIAGGGSYKAEPDHIFFYGDKFLFHAEDGSNTPGVYVQDVKTNSYYTIFEDRDPVDWGDGEETTGIASSPDGKCLIGCLQERGECFVVRRDDGGSFDLADQRRLFL